MVDLSRIEAVVFDLDDTLYPEIEFVRSGFRAVAASFENEMGPAADGYARLSDAFERGDRRRVFDTVLRERTGAADNSLEQRMVAAYRSHQPSIALHADAQRLLSRLTGRYRLGLISDGFAETQRNKIASLGIAGMLDTILLTDEFGREFWKPHPRAFQELAGRWRLANESLLYIADNPAKDFVAPRALKWTSVRIRRADGLYRDNVQPAGGDPDAVIDSLDELFD